MVHPAKWGQRFVMLYFAVVTLSVLIDSYNQFTHILLALLRSKSGGHRSVYQYNDDVIKRKLWVAHYNTENLSDANLVITATATVITTLQWRYNGRDGVSNHQPHDCLLNRSFRRRSKKNTKASRHWSLCGEFTGNRWILRTNGQ